MTIFKVDKKYYEVLSSCSPHIQDFILGLQGGTAVGVDFDMLRTLAVGSGADSSVLRITEGNRSYSAQNKLYEKGRKIKWVRKSWLPPVVEVESETVTNYGDIVTYAMGGASYHNYGCAVDIVFRAFGYNSYRYNGVERMPAWFYLNSGLVAWAAACGLEWGGNWSRLSDIVHFEDTTYKILPKEFRSAWTCNFRTIKNYNTGLAQGILKITDSVSFSPARAVGIGVLGWLIVGVFVYKGVKKWLR